MKSRSGSWFWSVSPERSWRKPGRGAAADHGKRRIRGTVVDATAGTPLRRASLRLRTVPSTRESWTAVTDGNGSFEFPSLPSGRFTITVSKGGYVNFNTPADAARSIQLTDGQTLDLPPLRLPRGGVITGSIRDEFGDPAPEIAVEAYRAEYMQGMRRLISVRSGKTDDIGRYRIYGLQPGTYYVAASARGEDGSPLQIMDPGTDTVPGAAGLAPTFYPGTVTAADAQRIQIAAGAESTGVDFALSPVRLARLTGVVIDARGKPVTSYAVMLNPARPDGALLGGAIVAETDANGRFTLGNVAPGDYRMDVYARAFFEASPRLAAPERLDPLKTWEFASVPITVAGEDVSGLSIKLTAGHSMSGRVNIEGAPSNSQALSSMQNFCDGANRRHVRNVAGCTCVGAGRWHVPYRGTDRPPDRSPLGPAARLGAEGRARARRGRHRRRARDLRYRR